MIRLLASIALSITLPAPPGFAQSVGQGGTLEAVRERGTLHCGVNPSQTGMAVQSRAGRWDGMGPDLCRAFAAAALGDANAVTYVPVTARTRFSALQSGEIDVLVRTTAWTYARDAAQGVDFVGTYYFEVERVLVRQDSGLTRFADLDGQPVCLITGSRTEAIIRNHEALTGISIDAVPVAGVEDYTDAYRNGRCVGVADGQAGLLALQAAILDPDSHQLIEEELAISPLSIGVRHGDDHWEDVIRWTFNALVQSEELGITQINASRLALESRHPIVRRLIHPEGGSGAALGLDADWALRAIQAVGNYGEIYERAFGANNALTIPRGRNELLSEGGMLTTQPFE